MLIHKYNLSFAFKINLNCRSDVLGQFMPLVGKDWSQNGVAHLFSSIKVGCVYFQLLSSKHISFLHYKTKSAVCE